MNIWGMLGGRQAGAEVPSGLPASLPVLRGAKEVSGSSISFRWGPRGVRRDVRIGSYGWFCNRLIVIPARPPARRVFSLVQPWQPCAGRNSDKTWVQPMPDVGLAAGEHLGRSPLLPIPLGCLGGRRELCTATRPILQPRIWSQPEFTAATQGSSPSQSPSARVLLRVPWSTGSKLTL